MRLIAFIVLCLALASVCQANETSAPTPELTCQTGKDCWWGPDKKQHLGAGFALGFLGSLGAAQFQAENPRLVGWGIGCAVGVGKELADKRFSEKDAVVTCLGAGLGALTGGLVIYRQGRETVVSYTRSF